MADVAGKTNAELLDEIKQLRSMVGAGAAPPAPPAGSSARYSGASDGNSLQEDSLSVKVQGKNKLRAARRATINVTTKKDKRWRINSKTSKFLPVWDGFVAFILCYIALATPYEIGFVEQADLSWSSFADPAFVISRLIDAIFIVDMGLQFFIMVPKAPKDLVVKPFSKPLGKLKGIGSFLSNRGSKKMAKAAKVEVRPADGQEKLITSFRGIAIAYFKSWFLIDALSVVSGFILFIQILRTVRCLRLLKLVRLLKSSRTFERLKSQVELDYSMQTIIGCMISYLVSAHWFACILAFTATFAPTPMHSYLGAKGYCIMADIPSPEDPILGMKVGGLPYGHSWKLQPVTPGFEALWELSGGVYCKAGAELWLSLFYWMIMLISGASGGDTNREDMLPGEQAAMTLIVIASALIWTMVIGNFVDVLANMNPEESISLKQLMSLHNQ